MLAEKRLRIALMICLALSLLLYHGLEVFFDHGKKPELFELLKVVQVVITAMFFILLLNLPAIARLVLRDTYIAGKYTGTANHLDPTPDHANIVNLEFTLDQSLFGASVSGKSYNDNGLVSVWTGSLYKIEGRKFSFAMELHWKDPEFGILNILVIGNSISGIYYSADPGYPYPYAINATRKP